MNKKINVLVTGAAGNVGSQVLKQLCEKLERYEITATDLKSKKSIKRFALFKNKIRIVYGDIAAFEFEKEVCRKQDVVIHLAGIFPPEADKDSSKTHSVNALGTQKLVEGLTKYSSNVFLLFSSSVAVYGDRLNDPYIKVGDPIGHANDFYSKSKIAAEQIIQQSELDWSIFRLNGLITQEETSSMFDLPLNTKIEYSTFEDTARAFINAIDKREYVSKRIFNLGGGEQMRIVYKDLLKRLFGIFGLGKPDFPQYAFAEHNYHVGYYEDSDKLEEILHFRSTTLEEYFEEAKNSIHFLTKKITWIFRKSIKRRMLKLSNPLKAYQAKNKKEMEFYFLNHQNF